MATSSTSCFPNDPQPGQPSHMYGGRDDPHQYVLSTTTFDSSSGLDTPSTSLLYNLSLLKEKLNQIQSLVVMCISPNHHSQTTPQSTVIAMANIGTLLQEIIIAASSMMFTCQQVSLGQTSSGKITNTTHESLLDRLPNNEGLLSPTQANYIETLDWFDQGYGNNIPATCNTSKRNCEGESIMVDQNSHERLSSKGYDIVEMDAADLLAKYTHYCQICGKGFKRDANLRMHMRAHGDEYKSNAALTNPMKKNSTNGNGGGEELSTDMPRKYSCPQEGCRWNKKHVKFQPLKSMICVKNHYKRSHCPKMYVCKRCNRKQFSVLSDLRTHEKHCGDLKWQCSCGTTFSRKDKLMGHVGLFVGHVPVEVGSGIARSRNIKIG